MIEKPFSGSQYLGNKLAADLRRTQFTVIMMDFLKVDYGRLRNSKLHS